MEIVKSKGLIEDNLRQWLAIDPLTRPPADDSVVGLRVRLINRIRSRIQEGMSRNFADFKLYYALDQAWDVHHSQVTPTLVAQFLDQDPNNENVYKAFQDWGLTHLVEERTDPKTNQKVKSLNVPTFFRVLVPLVQSYVKIRWAKIMNDRRLTPGFKFEPVKQTALLNLMCEALTDRIQVMYSQYGYYDVQKQAVLKMLHYGFCLQFPKAEWHWEDQWKKADALDVLLGTKKDGIGADGKTIPDGLPASVGDEILATAREGIIYHLPHPSRTFYDLAHGPYTFNYDFGCEYAGYWRIARYREIESSSFWNKDKIALGTADLVSGNRLFFTSVYSACTLTMPLAKPAAQAKTPEGPVLGAELGLGAGTTDREREIATLYYGTEHGDQGVLVTEYWERLVPKDNGLGEYDQPIWMRFVVAGDGATILYAAPVPYCPVLYYGYDADESRTKNASLSLEVLPFQDHFSNMLTQIILTCKQNLANLSFVDEDQLAATDPNQSNRGLSTIERIRNIGENLYRTLNIFAYSSKRAVKFQLSNARGAPDVVQSFNFPKGNVAEMTSVLKMILDVLERILVMSSQEIAQAASHELRVDEVRNIAASTSSRLLFTATPVDVARDAWKRQLYQGTMAYGDEIFWVQLPADVPLTEAQLNQMGFTVHHKEVRTDRDQFVHASIKKSSLTALSLWAFASTRDGDDRVDNSKTAQTMALLVQNLLNNPMTAQAIGSGQAIELANQIGRLAGLPKDFKLRDVTPEGADEHEQQQAAQEQLKATVDAVLKIVDGQMQQELTPLIDQVKETQRQVGVLSAAMQLNNRIQATPQNDTFGIPNNGGGAAAPPARMAG